MRDTKTNEELRKLQFIEMLKCHSTKEIIAAVELNKFPDKVMINTHPYRWEDRFLPWVKELVGQNVKNVVKKFIIQKRLRGTKTIKECKTIEGLRDEKTIEGYDTIEELRN